MHVAPSPQHRILGLTLLVLISSSVAFATTDLLWSRFYTGYQRHDDSITAVTTDASGNVYACGTTWRISTSPPDTSWDWVTVKYDPNGVEQWRSFYAGSNTTDTNAADVPVAICLDNSGNVFVTGTSWEIVSGTNYTSEITTIKYNGSTGNQMARNSFHGYTGWFVDEGTGMVFDTANNRLYVCGISFLQHAGNLWDFDYTVLRLNPNNLNPVWTKTWNSDPTNQVDDLAVGITLGPSLDPVVTGFTSSFDLGGTHIWTTLRIGAVDSSVVWRKDILWDQVGNDNEEPYAICTDANSNIFITGYRWDDGGSRTRMTIARIKQANPQPRVDTVTVDDGNDNSWGCKIGYRNGKIYAIGSVYMPNTYEDWATICVDTVGGSGQSRRLGFMWKRFMDGGAQVFDRPARRPPSHMPRLTPQVLSLRPDLARPKRGSGIDQGPGEYTDEAPTAIAFDNLNRLYVCGYQVVPGSVLNTEYQTWVVRRFDDRTNPTSPDTLWNATQRGLYYRRDTLGDNYPYSIALSDTDHIYVGGWQTRWNSTAPDSGLDGDQCVVRFGNPQPVSAILDSLRPVPADTVDSGYVALPPKAFFRNNGGMLASPTLYLWMDGTCYDTVQTPGTNPGASDSARFKRSWSALPRGTHVLKCSLKLVGDTSPGNNRVTKSFLVRVPDVGPVAFIGLADTIDEGATVVPQATIRNYGSAPATFPASYWFGASQATATVNGLPPDSTRTVTFSPNFTPARGQYQVRCTTALLNDAFPGNNRIIRSPDVFVRYKDVACRRIISPTGTINEGTLTPVQAWVRNLGNTAVTFWTVFKITGPANRADSVQTTLPAAGQSGDSTLLNFTSWLAQPYGTYYDTCYTRLAGDQQRSNDTVRGTFTVLRRDVGVARILYPTGTISPGNLQPRATVKNYGNSNENSIMTKFFIGAWRCSTVVSLNGGESLDVTFPDFYNAVPGGPYSTKCSTCLAIDADRSNDFKTGTFLVASRDVGVISILAPRDTIAAGNVAPRAIVHNYGNAAETFTAFFMVGAYSQTLTLNNVGPTRDTTITFPNWNATNGTYVTRCSVYLAADPNRSNDRMTGTVVVGRHDAGVVAILAPRDTIQTLGIQPRATVHNYGWSADNFTVVFQIAPAGYSQTLNVTLAAGAESTLTFPLWTTVPGSFNTTCSVYVAEDFNPANNVMRGSGYVRYPDASCRRIVAPTGIIDLNTVVTPQAWIRNLGNVGGSVTTRFRINSAFDLPADGDFALVYEDSVKVTLAAGESTLAVFGNWTATPGGNYATDCFTEFPGDLIPGNDTVHGSFRVTFHDVGVTSIIAPLDTIGVGLLYPIARVHNYGTETETFKAFFFISSGYADSASIIVPSGADQNVPFAGWNASLGSYVARCSVYLATDANHANDALVKPFVVKVIITPGWTQKADVPPGGRGKRVKDGGCLAHSEESDTHYVYALKGNGTCEFYKYNTSANSWATRESIPAFGSSGRKKAVKKGASIANTGSYDYATKGNSTYEFWQYDPAKSGTPAYPWTQKTDVPTGAKTIREGSGAAFVTIADTGYVYLLKGSNTLEFYRYNTLSNSWQTMAPAPAGTSGRFFKTGSCLTYDQGNTIYALKGSYNEFYAYRIDSNAWSTKTALPLYGSSGRKKKVKDGGAMAYAAPRVYALKGNNTQEFWSYIADSDKWFQKEDMPFGGSGKRVKNGGALVTVVDRLYALKGNNTFEFWQYTIGNGLDDAGSAPSAPQVERLAPLPRVLALTVSPNPLSRSTCISYSLPQPGNASLYLYDITGQLRAVLAGGYHTAGTASLAVQRSSLSAGIYLLKLETGTATATAKLIVE
jgi:hypothetical protein